MTTKIKHKKEWIKYSPKGVDTEYHTKMNLRNMYNTMGLLGKNIDIMMMQKNDFGDDEYSLRGIKIIARENGQKIYDTKEIKDQSGIFFFTDQKNKKLVESKLIELLQ